MFTTSDILAVISLAVFTVLWFRWTAKKASSKKKAAEAVLPLPPGPKGLPLVGYLPYLSPNLHRDFFELAKTYGPIFKFWMGNKLCVVISSPAMVGEVVRDQDKVFANRDVSTCAVVATYGGHDIVFGSYGPEWRKLRRIFVREMLNNAVLDNLYSLRKEEVKKSVKQIYDSVNTPLDIGNLAFLTAINSVMSMTIGTSLKGENAVIDGTAFKTAAEELMTLLGKPNLSDIFPALAWFDFQGIERDARKVTKFCEVMFDSAVAKRRNDMINPAFKDKEMRKDFLQFLMELHEQEDSANSITMPEIKALLMDTFLGATDTSTTTVEWALTELFRQPELVKRVQEELKQVVGLNNNVEEVHLSKLTYLSAVIKETLRLHAPVPFLVPRRPSESATVGGYHIPKGSTVFLNVWGIQRDPSVWENPLEFKPERFLVTNSNNDQSQSNFNYSGNNFSYLPFGSGRRMCAGVSLADRMVMLMVGSFLHSFNWEVPNGAKVEVSDKFGIILKKKDPLLAIPTPRLSDPQLYTT